MVLDAATAADKSLEFCFAIVAFFPFFPTVFFTVLLCHLLEILGHLLLFF